MKQFSVVLVASILVTIGVPASAQFDSVGTIDFPTSATDEAQQHFLRGVAILHSFGWKQAIEQFRAAQQVASALERGGGGPTGLSSRGLLGRSTVLQPSLAG